MQTLAISLVNDNLNMKIYEAFRKIHYQTNNFMTSLPYGESYRHTKSSIPLWDLQIVEESNLSYLFGNNCNTKNVNHLQLPKYGLIQTNGRTRSANTFKNKQGLDLSIISSLLGNAFGYQGTIKHKAYPSAGGLYPVDAFLYFFEGDKNIKNKGFYYNAEYHRLEYLNTVNPDTLKHDFFNGEEALSKNPSFIILYAAYAAKSLVKYNERGYRFILLETGSMYQNATLYANALNISTRVWSGFDDQCLAKHFNLDTRVVWPMISQMFGYEE